MFIYKQWDEFCYKLKNEGYFSATASSILDNDKGEDFLILKHDVETDPLKALVLAEIESNYGHKGSYYVQAYLLNNKRNIKILKAIQDLGHEVSYHHDVMDSNRGNIKRARIEFNKYIKIFEENGFTIRTVCQHGNPVIERKGYTSNRDFFRSNEIINEFSGISEIMVDFKNRTQTDYKYISDAGYGWKVIFDPENNDLIDSSDQDIPLDSLNNVIDYIKSNRSVVVSTHPHRWHKSEEKAIIKDFIFKVIKTLAKVLLRMPYMKKVMGKFYFLAKKI